MSDPVTDLVQQTLAQPTRTRVPDVEPIYGGSTKIELSEAPVAATVPAIPATPAAAPPAPVVLAAAENQKQVFSSYNATGSVPPGFRCSSSCMKCEHFSRHYSSDCCYSLDFSGHCYKHDFPCNAGYTCDDFVLYGSAEATAELALAEPVVAEQEVVAQEPEVLAEPVVETKLPEKPVEEEVDVFAAEFSDKELYAEAMKVTETKFKEPTSQMGKTFAKYLYKSFYKARHQTLEGAFV